MSDRPTYKIRRAQIDPRLLMRLLTTGEKLEVIEGIPAGAVYVGQAFDITTGLWNIYFTHEKYTPVPSGEMVPLIEDILIRGQGVA